MTSDTRAQIVAEALSFEGTAYHHMGRIKIKRDATGEVIDKGGVDCAQFPYLVFFALGMVPFVKNEYYPPDWFLHQGEERLLNMILKLGAVEIDTPLPGDVLLWKIGRVFSHTAIILDTGWPDMVHAAMDARVVMRDRADGGRLQAREFKTFTMLKAE